MSNPLAAINTTALSDFLYYLGPDEDTILNGLLPSGAAMFTYPEGAIIIGTDGAFDDLSTDDDGYIVVYNENSGDYPMTTTGNSVAGLVAALEDGDTHIVSNGVDDGFGEPRYTTLIDLAPLVLGRR